MYKNKHLILFLFLFFRASLPLLAESGLQISLALDLLADFKLNKESKVSYDTNAIHQLLKQEILPFTVEEEFLED